MNTHRCTPFILTILLLGFAAPAFGGGLLELEFDTADFNDPTRIDNPWWPLAEATHFVYFESSEDECILNDFTVTSMLKNDFQGDYAGITARVVWDREWLDEGCDGTRNALLEDTFDWYAQDDDGNVWYLGEETTEYLFDDDGEPIGSTTEGSWEAGMDGAEAGIIIPADPSPGMFYRQEYLEGEAEDMGKVLRLNVSVETQLGDFVHCMVTKEWSPLSPGTVEQKTYCEHVGLVVVEELTGGKTTRVEAVEINLP